MKKVITFTIIILILLSISYMWRIIYAVGANSEKIDGHMFQTMIQGRFYPCAETNLFINGKIHTILLPEGSGKINESEYLIPSSSWEKYLSTITKKSSEWDNTNQLGTYVRITNSVGDEFDISFYPYTGVYIKIKYYTVNKVKR